MGSFCKAVAVINLDLFDVYGKQPEIAFFSDLIFSMPILKFGSLNIPAKFRPCFRNIKKNTDVEAFFSEKNLTRRCLTWPFPVKVSTKCIGENQLFNFD